MCIRDSCRDARSERPLSNQLDAVTFDTTDAQTERPYSGLPVNPLHVRACLQLFRKNPTALLAVSYTHLDVYKRQGEPHGSLQDALEDLSNGR